MLACQGFERSKYISSLIFTDFFILFKKKTPPIPTKKAFAFLKSIFFDFTPTLGDEL